MGEPAFSTDMVGSCQYKFFFSPMTDGRTNNTKEGVKDGNNHHELGTLG